MKLDILQENTLFECLFVKLIGLPSVFLHFPIRRAYPPVAILKPVFF
jgi:hypothetical protein